VTFVAFSVLGMVLLFKEIRHRTVEKTMYKFLIAFLIILTTATLRGQTTPRSGANQSVNTSKTTLAPAAPSTAKPSSGNSREVKTQKQSERTSTPATHNTRTETSERSTGSTTTTSSAAKGKSGSSATPRRTTRPAYTTPPQNKGNAPRTSGTDRKKATTKPEEKVSINWLTLEQAIEKSKTEKRKIFVDVYTSWCGWCKHMDSTTFVSGAVAKYLNEHYYPVKFNAEQQGDIVFKDKTYHFKKSGTRGHHELAAEWLNNRLTFPTIVFLDENMTLIQPLAGYQDATKMEAIINYFATDSHKKTPWESYEKKFVPGQ
jgi:thioredoxin-related protein